MNAPVERPHSDGSTLSFADFYTIIRGTWLPCAGMKALFSAPYGSEKKVHSEEDLAGIIGEPLAAKLWMRYWGAHEALRNQREWDAVP